MYKNIKVEAENLELILENSHGDKVIIPANKRNWVKQKLSEGCHDCIDSLVETLPTASQYAQDGSLYPENSLVNVYTGDSRYNVKQLAPREGSRKNKDNTESTHLMTYTSVDNKYYAYPTLFQNKDKSWLELSDKNNWEAFNEAKKRKELFEFEDKGSAEKFAKGSWKDNYKEYNVNSKEYRDLYNSGKLMSYDENTDTYIATPLKEVTVTAEAPQWLKYKREYEKNSSKSDYISKYLTPFARNLGYTETNYPKRLDDEYEQKALDYVSEQLVKNKPQDKLSRAEWLNQMSDKEEELIKRNPKYQSSLWADTKRGLTSLVEQSPLQTFQNILNSSDYTNREKQEMLKDYIDHPMMSKLGDAAKILNSLTVPSKMVQSAYKDDYSFTDALKGKKNNAGIVEDIVTDPLNLVGVGLASKLSKADKVIDATKVGSKVLNKTDNLTSSITNQLDEIPHEIRLDNNFRDLDDINLQRNSRKVKKEKIPYEDVEIGNDLYLRKNPSRTTNPEKLLGKNRAIISVKNKNNSEYIDLKSWKDENGDIYYYMSANMPSSKIKAGKAYLELEKHIPKGASLLENSSLSYDSLLNILKQTKNPKFETFVKGRIPMNDMSVSNKLKSIGDKSSDSVELGFYSKNIADNAVIELNELLNKYNLPEATVVKRTTSYQPQAHLPYEKKDIFEIELPNIGLKKLYSIIGLTSAGAAIQSQNQNKTE